MYGTGIQKFKRFRSKKRTVSGARKDYHELSTSPTSARNELVVQAQRLRDEGEYSEAIRLFEIVAQDRGDHASQLASYELALLQSQLGNHTEADKNLSTLGFTLKLAHPIMCPLIGTEKIDLSGIISEADSFNPVLAFDNLLPPSLLQPLLNAFSPTSSFWVEHDYPTDDFFSYNVANDDEASLMKQIIDFITPLADKHFSEMNIASKSSSVEWWCHKREKSSGYAHQMHFDLDENALRSYRKHIKCARDTTPAPLDGDENTAFRDGLHPLISAVLYLSNQADAAPTLVTDQTLDSDSEASQAWLCHPAENRLLLFDGKLLHGVTPFLGSKQKHHKDPLEPRITIMMGWWAKEFQDSTIDMISNSKRTLFPNMAMPLYSKKLRSKSYSKARNTNQLLTWPLLLAPVASKGSTKLKDHPEVKTRRCSDGLVHVRGPIWIPVISETKIGLSRISTVVDAQSAVVMDVDGFISMDDLMKLRSAPSVGLSDDEDEDCVTQAKGSHSSTKRKHRRKKEKRNSESMSASDKCRFPSTACSASNDVVFVGKWFLKSTSEIRDDVLN